LTVDLTDAERYRDAYHKLLDEVGVLAARNQLAESEANRLSQFNAEILGHNNPSQRIVYLDRVRRELAETKQVRCVRVFGTRQQPNVDFFIFTLIPNFRGVFFIQMLIVASRERDAASAQIESLRRELSLYLSVPAAEGKKLPRATTMTRVGRMPLVPVTQSEKVNNNNNVASALRRVGGSSDGDFEEHLPPLAEGEMTLDEIM
jgi:hypothetical protein